MTLRSNVVNLDAMIARADFALLEDEVGSPESITTLSIRDFTRGALIGPSLRKPDFQRETNHWTPDQVALLLQCFVSGDLIPSVILWASPAHLFVIDGGHRLSALRAWIEDDYGDRHISQSYFGYSISEEQKKNAARTRKLVDQLIGPWSQYEKKIADQAIAPEERKKYNTVVSRALPIQWVRGDVGKAESSFFKINTKGTPLDSVEEMLLKNRRKPIPIAARAIIRAGKGHRYWSSFSEKAATEIESVAARIHKLLFDPEFESPVKTLDLPLGGPKGVRQAIQALLDLTLIAVRNQYGIPSKIANMLDDSNGDGTIEVLNKVGKLAERVTGTHPGSLGLHPAVYFYGPTGRHSGSMFMGTMELIAKKLFTNDKEFFKKFTRVRSALEDLLVVNKGLIATIMQKNVSPRRVKRYAELLGDMINILADSGKITDSDIVEMSGFAGKIFVGTGGQGSVDFSDDVKSHAFITVSLANAIKCPICDGYLDPAKSASYDHSVAVNKGGKGKADNCQITHPYCNTSVKGGA